MGIPLAPGGSFVLLDLDQVLANYHLWAGPALFCQSASIETHVDSFTKLKIFAIPLLKKFVDSHHPLLDLRILEFLEPNEPVEDILSN